MARLFYPLQSHSGLQSNVILWHAHCDPPAIPLCFHPDGWNHSGYKTLTLFTQFKQDKVHMGDSPHCSPTQSSSETLPVFSVRCFHRNRWNHSGLRNFNPFHSVLLPTGMGGKLKTPSSCTVYSYIALSCKISLLSRQWTTKALIRLRGWMSWGFTSLQQYFSHFETMEGWTWKALCN